MISAGQMPTYFTANTITYICNSGYKSQNVREITCTCNATNTDNWSCSIPVDDFETECEKG